MHGDATVAHLSHLAAGQVFEAGKPLGWSLQSLTARKVWQLSTMHRLCVGPRGIQYRMPLQSWIVGLAIPISEGPLSISHWLGLGVELFLPARARGRVRIAVSPHWLGLRVELV